MGVFMIKILLLLFIMPIVITVTASVINDKIKEKKARVRNTPPPMPAELSRIRYVRVNYESMRNRNDRGNLDYEGSVSWSAYERCWEFFIDNCTFVDKMIIQKSISFLDANKNQIHLQGYSFSTKEVIEGDCGKVLFYKR